MTKVRLVKIPSGYRIEVRRRIFGFWTSRWVDGGREDFDSLKEAQEAFILFVANRGPRIVIAEQ